MKKVRNNIGGFYVSNKIFWLTMFGLRYFGNYSNLLNIIPLIGYILQTNRYTHYCWVPGTCTVTIQTPAGRWTPAGALPSQTRPAVAPGICSCGVKVRRSSSGAWRLLQDQPLVPRPPAPLPQCCCGQETRCRSSRVSGVVRPGRGPGFWLTGCCPGRLTDAGWCWRRWVRRRSGWAGIAGEKHYFNLRCMFVCYRLLQSRSLGLYRRLTGHRPWLLMINEP